MPISSNCFQEITGALQAMSANGMQLILSKQVSTVLFADQLGI